MPLTNAREQRFPEWCELEHFDLVTLTAGQEHRFTRRARREKLIVATGACRVRYQPDGVAQATIDAAAGANLDLAAAATAMNSGDSFAIETAAGPTTLVRMCGSWGDEVGGSGIFTQDNVAESEREDRGDPVDYPKTTAFDAHWHDCDEYWITFAGQAEVVSEGRHYVMGPGDCLITGMHHHHDVRHVIAPLAAVYFETTLMGAKRRGHLWNHTHGAPQPSADRT